MARVFVQHEPRYNSNGDVIGVSFRKQGHVIQDVVREYIHKDVYGNRIVRTSSGDIWSVKPVTHAQYSFVTV